MDLVLDLVEEINRRSKGETEAKETCVTSVIQ